MMRDALTAAQNEAEPCLAELIAEVATLREALAHHFSLSIEELRSWDEHCVAISSCGGNPSSYEHWKVETALSEYEYAAY